MYRRIALSVLLLVCIPITAQANSFVRGVVAGVLIGGDWAFDNSGRPPKIVWTVDQKVLNTADPVTVKTVSTTICHMCANAPKTLQQVWEKLQKDMPQKERVVLQAATGIGLTHTAIRFAYTEK